jgi:hypothetical protein
MIRRLASLVPALAVIVSLHSVAHADDYDDAPPPPPTYPQPRPLYPAPLSQTTQDTYVPQSVALSGPEEIDHEEGRRAPTGYTPVQRKRKGLLIGGGVTLGVSYFYSALIAAVGEDTSTSFDGTSESNPVAAMWIPVAGPFIQMADTDSATLRIALAGLGAAQVTGAILLYYGLTTTKTVYVRNDLVGNMTISPMVGNGSSGLAISGNF